MSAEINLVPPSVAFHIKSSSYTLTTIELHTSDIPIISDHLQYLIHKAPQFLQNAPIVISLEKLNHTRELNLTLLRHRLEDYGIILIAIKGASDQLKKRFPLKSIAWLSSGNNKKSDTKQKSLYNHYSQTAATKTTLNSYNNIPEPPARIVRGPIRSGQQHYAEGDLTVIGSVGEGSEILAKGHIHIYGTLRGRALAGVDGFTGAHIFCSHLQAELIAIGGKYQLAADIKEDYLGKSVMIHINNHNLHIQVI